MILQILNVLQQLNFTGGANDWASAQKVIETFKFAYVDRMKMGDPAFIPDPDGIVARIVSAERASQIAPRIHAVCRQTPCGHCSSSLARTKPFLQSIIWGMQSFPTLKATARRT